jgi:hypothetical protein
MNKHKTSNLSVAAWLHSSGRLPFLGLEWDGPTAVFVFRDDNHEGQKLELEFELGAFSRYHHSLRVLRKLMDTDNDSPVITHRKRGTFHEYNGNRQ